MSDETLERARCALQVTSTPDDLLKRLVETSTQEVHLICDLTHRLLAASPRRKSTWRVDAGELIGKSLIGFASEEILKAEADLDKLGWYTGAVSSLTITTRSNNHPIVPIKSGRLLWERLHLCDGTAARLVTTI